jgi:hypothetical protein
LNFCEVLLEIVPMTADAEDAMAEPMRDENPWVIPLHGVSDVRVDVPPPRPKPRPMNVAAEDIAHLYADDGDLPTIEFRPRLLRRAA